MSLKDTRVLITGGTGSLSRAVIETLLPEQPRSIRLFSRNEEEQRKLEVELNTVHPGHCCRFQIGDVRDKDRLSRAMNQVAVVIHCAALKQVPTCEYNPIEAVRTNVDGAVNVIDAAIDNGVDKVIAISSDKAVHPVNIYGATKLVAEKLFIHGNVYGNTRFSCIRFGNFWGSRGSVVPIWQEQAATGHIKVTDIGMMRWWITLPDAARFVLKCIERMVGGEIFIPIMSQKTLEEVARDVAPNATLEIIGKRAGEKMNELLWSEAETPNVKILDDCYVIKGG